MKQESSQRTLRSLLLILTLLSLLWPAVATAAMTVGWKVPIGYIYFDFTKNPWARKLDRAPGESAYFQPGDALWEISRCLQWPAESGDEDPLSPAALSHPADPVSPWTGEWVVWNERSGLVIARGTRNEIAAMDGVLGLAASNLIVNTRVELIRHGDPQPLRSLTLTSQSDEVASFATEDLEIKITSVIQGDSNSAITRFQAQWDAPNSPGLQWRLDTLVPLLDRERTLIARHGDLEFCATSELRLYSGTPRLACRSRESAGNLINYPFRTNPNQPVFEDLDNGLVAAWCGGPEGSESDPFAPSAPPEPPARLEIPANLKAIAHGDFLTLGGNAKTQMKRITADEGKTLDMTGFFAAQDQLSGLILFAGRKATVEFFASRFTRTSPDISPLEIRIEAGAGPEAWTLLGSPGETSRLSLGRRGGAIERLFEIRPGPPAASGAIELGYTLDAAPSHFSTSLQLQRDQPVKIGDGLSAPVEVTAHWREIGK